MSGTDDANTPDNKAGPAHPAREANGDHAADNGSNGGPESGSKAGEGTVGGPTIDKMTALGSAVWLMTQSPAHKHLLISDVDWLLVPPISLVQFRIWRRGSVPIGFATWGYIGEEVEERLKSGATRLKPDDWKSGDRPWLIDLILPFGGQDDVLKELREVVFKGQQVKTLRPAPDGSGLKMVDL